MSVYYKFKSSLDFDTVKFDGLHISVDELKKAILQNKKIGKSSDFDLQITHAQTKEGELFSKLQYSKWLASALNCVTVIQQYQFFW